MKITSDGQITIPLAIRQQLELLPGTEIEFEVVGDGVFLKRKTIVSSGEQLMGLMQGKATTRLSTDEIMTLTRQDE
jgi:AbrB family looped-hinge helix DNA binding protein